MTKSRPHSKRKRRQTASWINTDAIRSPARTTTPDRQSPFTRALQLLPLLALAGIIVYALLSTIYERFYGPLGIRPADVGLTYANTLANSTGVVVFFIGAVIFASVVAGVTVILSMVIYHRHWKFTDIQSDARFLWDDFWNSKGPLIVMIIAPLVPFIALTSMSAPSAERVKLGSPIVAEGTSIFGIIHLPVSTFPISAYPASVEAVQGARNSPSTHELRARPLLYLGQSNGIAVLYDSSQDQALFLPLVSTILKIQSCATADDCFVPARIEATCIVLAKTGDQEEIAAIGVDPQGRARIMEANAIEGIRYADLSLYFRDPSGKIVDIVVGGPQENPYLTSAKISAKKTDLLSLPSCDKM